MNSIVEKMPAVGCRTRKAIAARFAQIRAEEELTIADVAAAIGASNEHVAGIERGTVALAWRYAGAFCEQFDVTLHWLATGEGEPRGYEPIPEELDQTTYPYNVFGPLYQFVLERVASGLDPLLPIRSIPKMDIELAEKGLPACGGIHSPNFVVEFDGGIEEFAKRLGVPAERVLAAAQRHPSYQVASEDPAPAV